MNRYVHGICCVTVGIIKTSALKVVRGNKVRCTYINLVSPGTEITVDKGGKLSLGKLFKMRGGSKLRVRKNAIVSIGNNFSMGNWCIITAYERIEIGDDVQFGPGVLVFDQDHDFRTEGGLSKQRFITAPIVVGNNVWVGANSIILRGTTIGDNCVIAAGSVVKGVIPADTVYIQKREKILLPYTRTMENNHN